MKIALVHEMLTKMGGAERVVKTFSDLFPEAPIYTLLHDAKASQEWFGDKKIHSSYLQNLDWLPKQLLLPKMAGAIEQFDFSDYDVVLSSSSAFVHGIKTPKNVKHICYCHSPMRYAWDYTHEYTKNWNPIKRFLAAHILHSVRQWDYRVADRPDILIANSNHVRQRVQKYWRRDAQVVHPPVNVKRFKPTKSHDDYFFIVSALTPFKKIDLAIQAFNKVKRRLVIIGDGAQRKYLEFIAGPTIQFLGRQSDEVVKEYMENCRAFIFPGEEDFGITPVEAMAAGKPVLAYSKGGVTESVQAGVSGEFFEELTSESLENGLTRLLQNEKQYDVRKIRKIAEGFDEAVFKSKMKQIINSYGGSSPA